MRRTRCSPEEWEGERDSVVPLVAIMLFVSAAVLASIGATALHSVRLAQAQWAADSAALAIAAAGSDSAGIAAGRGVAAANGADVIAISTSAVGAPLSASHLSGPGPAVNAPSGTTPMEFLVVVEVDRLGVTAVAAARRSLVSQP